MTGNEERKTPLVALIDDEEDITTYLGMALQDNGYRVVSTTDPSEALDMLEREAPDLICLDLLMPERTGFSLYASLVEHNALGAVPIVILSGLAERHELPAILNKAGDLPEPADFLEKPVDIGLFLRTVKSLLGEREGAPS